MLRLLCVPALAFVLTPLLGVSSASAIQPVSLPKEAVGPGTTLLVVGPREQLRQFAHCHRHRWHWLSLNVRRRRRVVRFFWRWQTIEIARTAKNSKRGRLALPKGGRMTRRGEPVWQLTAQPFLKIHYPPNGFAALSVYDITCLRREQNGRIDPRDPMW